MVSGKEKIKRKIDGQTNEFENLLGAMLAPVAPRGEFVHQLQKQLESKFDPQPLLILPAKFINLIVVGLVGLLGGIGLTILGIKWIKRNVVKGKWRVKGIHSGNNKGTGLQLP